MKTVRKLRLAVLLAVCFGLGGCAQAIMIGGNLATIGLTYLIMDHETDRAIDATVNANKEILSSGGKYEDRWLQQCMSENQHYWVGIEDPKKRQEKRDEILASCKRLMHETNDVN